MIKTQGVIAAMETTLLTVAVNGAPGGAGVAVGNSVASSSVVVTNTSNGAALEYKAGAGAWLKLLPSDSIELAIDLSVTALVFRRARYDGGLVSAQLIVASKPTLSTSEAGMPISTGGAITATITGTGVVDQPLTATLPTGYVGTLQFTRSTKAATPVKTNISGAVANAVNSLSYTPVFGDTAYTIGCDTSNVVAPSASVSISAGGSSGGEYADVVIFAGQSQSNSNGTNPAGGDVPASLQGAMTNAFTWDPFNNVWLTYEAGVNSAVHLEGGKYPLPGARYHGMEAEYLRRWREQNPGVPIYMIKKGHSTTSIDQAARTTNRGCWDPALAGDLFDELVSWVAAAYASIRALGKEPRLRAINWIQGENEADVSVAANRYQTTLETFISAVRSRVDGAANAPFVISRIQTATWNFPALIRSAQIAVAANAANNARWFDADSAAVSSDMVHYSPAGCVTLGRICYEANLSASDITARYVSRMTVAPSSARQAALTALFSSLASTSVWPTITAMQLYASHDQQSALVSSGYVAATGVPTNQAFVADQGFTGSGTGSHIDTGYSLATTDPRYTANSNSQSVWIRSKASDTGIDLGAFTGGATILAMVVGNTAIRVNAASDSGNIVTAVTKRTGLNTVMRLGASDSRLFQDGAQLGATATSPVGAIPTGNVWVGDRSGGSSSPTTAQYSAFIAGMSRTAPQEADLYTALNTYLTSIGAA